MEFHDADTDTDTDILARILADTSDTRDFLKLFLLQTKRHADILATILARMSVAVSVSASVSASCNASFSPDTTGRHVSARAVSGGVCVSCETHELGGSAAVDRHAVDGGDLVSESEVDEFDVEAASTLHDDVVWSDAQVHDAAVMQELHRVQHLYTRTQRTCLSLECMY